MRLSLKWVTDFTINSGLPIIIKNWIKWKKFPAVTEFMRLLKNLKKIQDFNGIWTRNLAIPVRCSNQLSYEATEIGSWSIVFIYVPVKEMNVIDVHEINHIRTAEMKSKNEGSSQLWTEFINCLRSLQQGWFVSGCFCEFFLLRCVNGVTSCLVMTSCQYF